MAGQEDSQLWFLRIKDLSYPTLRPHSDWEAWAGFSPCGISPACQDEQASMFSPAPYKLSLEGARCSVQPARVEGQLLANSAYTGEGGFNSERGLISHKATYPEPYSLISFLCTKMNI